MFVKIECLIKKKCNCIINTFNDSIVDFVLVYHSHVCIVIILFFNPWRVYKSTAWRARARYKWCVQVYILNWTKVKKKAFKSPAAAGNLSTVNFVCLTFGRSRIIFIVIIVRATLSLVRETSYTFRSENSLCSMYYKRRGPRWFTIHHYSAS